jgi:hypothetical protein
VITKVYMYYINNFIFITYNYYISIILFNYLKLNDLNYEKNRLLRDL